MCKSSSCTSCRALVGDAEVIREPFRHLSPCPETGIWEVVDISGASPRVRKPRSHPSSQLYPSFRLSHLLLAVGDTVKDINPLGWSHPHRPIRLAVGVVWVRLFLCRRRRSRAVMGHRERGYRLRVRILAGHKEAVQLLPVPLAQSAARRTRVHLDTPTTAIYQSRFTRACDGLGHAKAQQVVAT
jgi:hypothetical protein